MNDEGFPHSGHTTCDSGEAVFIARNDSARPMRPEVENDPAPKWFKEDKPRIRDAAHNSLILAYVAQLTGGACLTFVFDFKYFFHQFVRAVHELWASGALVPKLLPEGKVSSHLVCVVTTVMAMGVSPASNVAQDIANMFMWKLLRLVDLAGAEHARELCRRFPRFARVWRMRQCMPHEDYGTQARLVDGLMYTDDARLDAATPDIGVELLVQFAHMISARRTVGLET